MMDANNELKVVMRLEGDKALVGIWVSECDPVWFHAEGNLKTVLAAVPGFIKQAKERWEQAKLNPKCESPLPSQAEARATATQRVATTSRTQKSDTQSPMF
jgi:hypothetical protein